MHHFSSSPKRIAVFGLPGSGKSTFADRLSKILHLPLHHLDRHFYQENWVERDKEEFLSIQSSIANQDEWILDGNAVRSLEIRYKKADLMIHFRLPRLLCTWRTIKRRIWPNYHLQDRAEGCAEKIPFRLLKYLWTYPARINPILSDLKNRYPHTPLIEVTTTKEMKDLFKKLTHEDWK